MQKAIYKKADECFQAKKKRLQVLRAGTGGWMAISADTSTELYKRHNYLNIMAHVCNENFDLETIHISTLPFEGCSDNVNLLKATKEGTA